MYTYTEQRAEAVCKCWSLREPRRNCARAGAFSAVHVAASVAVLSNGIYARVTLHTRLIGAILVQVLQWAKAKAGADVACSRCAR